MLLESYIHLFIDSFFAFLILPIRSEMMYKAMINLGNFNLYLVNLVALLGSISGLIVNWQIGKYFIFLKESKLFINNKKELVKIEYYWNKYCVWLLLIASFNSIGSVMSLFSGFLKTKFIYFLILIFIGRLINYLILIWYNL